MRKKIDIHVWFLVVILLLMSSLPFIFYKAGESDGYYDGYTDYESPSSPKIVGEITYEELANFFMEKLGKEKMYAIYIMDGKYSLTTVQEVERFLRWDRTNKFIPAAKKDEFDCDDFAIRLMGQITIPGWSAIPFGIIYAENLSDPDSGIDHAYNLFITKENDQLRAYGVEPSDHRIFPLPLSEIKHLMLINLP